MAINEKTLTKFSLLLITVFATPPKEVIADQLDFDDVYQKRFKKEYRALMKIILAVKTSDMALELLRAYLVLYGRNSHYKNNIHFYQSDHIFSYLVQQCIAAETVHKIIFGATIENFIRDTDPSLQSLYITRVSELSATVKSKILAFFASEKNKFNQNKSVIDLLKIAFEKAQGYKAGSLDQLYEFDPYPDAEFKTSFDWFSTQADTLWSNGIKSYNEFNGLSINAFVDSFVSFAKTACAKDIMRGFQLIKYLQDRLRTRSPGLGMPLILSTGTPLIKVMYLLACKQLAIRGSHLGLRKNMYWLTREEEVYFLWLLKKDNLYSNYVKLIQTKNSELSVAAEQGKALLNLYCISENFYYDHDLVDTAKCEEIAKFWISVDVLMHKIKDLDQSKQLSILREEKNTHVFLALNEMLQQSVENTSGPNLSHGRWGVGSIIGRHRLYGDAAIAFFDMKTNSVYIEYASLGKQLFRVSATSSMFASYAYGARITDIHNSTIGVVYLAQIMIMAIPFLPVLIEAGFAALVYEVAIFYGSMKLEELVSEIDPTVGKVVGLASQVIAPRPKFAPALTNPGASSNATKIVVIDESAQQFVTSKPFSERLDLALKDERLITDFEQGTISKAKDTITDRLAALPELSRKNIDLTLDKALEHISEPLLLRQLEPAAVSGVSLRTRGTSVKGPGAGGKPSQSARITSAASSKVRKSEINKALENYYQYLETTEATLTRSRANAIFEQVDRGVMTLSEAENKLRAVLNTAKEQTGEYVAESLIRSNYKVLDIVRIPHRGAGAPVLDLVLKIKGARGRTEYILVEAKGGVRTKLGEVSAKKITVEKGQIKIAVIDGQTVRQASPEWYFQKIVEIYQSKSFLLDTRAAARAEREYQRLAKELLAGAKQGKVHTAIIKSNSAMDPKFSFSGDDFIDYFANLKFEFPN